MAILEDQSAAVTSSGLPGKQPLQSSPFSFAEYLIELWEDNYLANRWISLALAVAALVYLLCITFIGPVVTTVGSHDDFLLLDGGWRILNGLVPHRDFYLSSGSLTYLFVAVGLWLTNNSVLGLPVGIALWGAIVAVTAFVVSRTRLTALGCIVFTSFCLLLITAPFPLGTNSASDLSYAMVYNRAGDALLGILLVIQFSEIKHAALQNIQKRGEVIAGICLAALLFIKVSYFGVGVAFTAASYLLYGKRAKRLPYLLAGFSSLTIFMGVFLRFDFLDMFRDLRITTLSRVTTLPAVPHALFGFPAKLFFATAFCCIVFNEQSRDTRTRVRLFVFSFGTILAEALFDETNAWQGATFSLCTVALLVLMTKMTSTRCIEHPRQAFFATVLVFSFLQISPLPYAEVRSVLKLAEYKRHIPTQLGPWPVTGAQVSRLALMGNERPSDLSKDGNGREYAAYLNSGTDLLQRNSKEDESVTTLGFHNPFSYLLLRKPALGGSVWLSAGNNISERNLLPPERIFGNATLVMVPSYPSSHSGQDRFLFTTYKDYLLTHFQFVDKSEWWQLYRRKG